MPERPLTGLHLRVLRAMGELGAMGERQIVAEQVGRVAKVARPRRAGSGAVKGSWSGYVARGFAVASTMRALVRRGLLAEHDSGRERYVSAYRLTAANEAAGEAERARTAAAATTTARSAPASASGAASR